MTDAHASPPRTDTRERTAWLFALGVIVVTAAVLRYWYLAKQGLWFDEIWTVNTSMHGPIDAIKGTAKDTNPPLFYAIEALFLAALGHSDTAARAYPWLTGVLTTAVMYLAGRRMFDRMTGVCAAALFAVSAIAVQYAQEARMYSQFMLFGALLLWALAALIERRDAWATAGLTLALVGAVYTHVFGYFMPAIVLFAVVVVPGVRRRIGKQALVACVITGLLFVPWAFVVPAQIEYVSSRAVGGGWWMERPQGLIGPVLTNLSAFAPAPQLAPSILFIVLLVLGVAPLPAVLRSPSNVDDEARRPVTTTESALLLAAIALGPMLIGIVISILVMPIYTIRNTLVGLPAAYLLASWAIVRLRRPLGIAAFAALLVAGLLQHPQRYPHNAKGGWYRVAMIASRYPEKLVLTDKGITQFSLVTYPVIRGKTPSPNVVWADGLDATPAFGFTPERTRVSIPEVLKTVDTVYVVTERRDETATGEYMASRPGWEYLKTLPIYKPMVRVYKRTE